MQPSIYAHETHSESLRVDTLDMDLVRFISVKFLYQLLIICPDTSRNMKFTYRGKLIIT